MGLDSDSKWWDGIDEVKMAPSNFAGNICWQYLLDTSSKVDVWGSIDIYIGA
jgi:hypothetical protein